jgi:hypothetical protein
MERKNRPRRRNIDPAVLRPGNDRELSELLRTCLMEGRTVEIDGVGTLTMDKLGAIRFTAEAKPQVFLAYAAEDYPFAERLYSALEEAGFEPWLDRRKLLPGQNWPRAIEHAIEGSRFFVACMSHRSVSKRGRFHAEMRYALDCAAMQPLGDTYFIPVRLDDCAVPLEIQRAFQYLDLFPDWQKGFERLAAVLRRQERLDRRGKQPPKAA